MEMQAFPCGLTTHIHFRRLSCTGPSRFQPGVPAQGRVDGSLVAGVTRSRGDRERPSRRGRRSGFPTLSLQSLRRRLDPYPAASLDVPCPFLPESIGLTPRKMRSAREIGVAEPYFGAAVIRLLQAPTLARPPDCIHRSPSCWAADVYTTHRRAPFRDVASSCPTWAIDTAGHQLAALSAAPCRIRLLDRQLRYAPSRPRGPGSQAMATAIPTACLASSAIRCRDVETGPNLGVLAVALHRCHLPVPPSLHGVSWAQFPRGGTMRHSDSSPPIPPRFVAFARRYHPSTCGSLRRTPGATSTASGLVSRCPRPGGL